MSPETAGSEWDTLEELMAASDIFPAATVNPVWPKVIVAVLVQSLQPT
jgi:hypothetical protein